MLAMLSLGVGLLSSGVAQAQVAPGFGSDERRPQGPAFVLPPGLEVAGPIVGADDDGNCPRPQTKAVGSGLWVRACLPVRNRTGSGVTVVFPPGLVIVSASEGFQNGLLVESQLLVVPPYTVSGNKLRDKKDSDIVYVPLHTYCINKAKDPSTPSARFELGPVSRQAGFSELFAFMADKDFRDDGTRVEVLQEVIYDMTKSGRFTAQHRADLIEAWQADGVTGRSPKPQS
jgi:hypothetical protein